MVMKKDSIHAQQEAKDMTLGERIKEQRKSAGFSQEKLAERMGISRQAVTKWESGQSAPSSDNLFKLAEVLGCPVSALLDNGQASGRSPAEEVYYQLKLEQIEQTLARQKRWLKNFRNAGLVLLAYLLLLCQQLIANGYGRLFFLAFLEPIDVVYAIQNGLKLTYLIGWLLHGGLFWTSMLISAVPAVFGKWRFSALTTLVFIMGVLLGEPLGQSVPGIHWGWAIWGYTFFWSIVMGIVLEVISRSSLKLKSRKFIIWLVIFGLGYTALMLWIQYTRATVFQF